MLLRNHFAIHPIHLHQHAVAVVDKILVKTTPEGQQLVVGEVIGGVDASVVFEGDGQHFQVGVGVGFATVVGGAVVHHQGLHICVDRVARLVHQGGLQFISAIDQAQIGLLVPGPAPNAGCFDRNDVIRGHDFARCVFEDHLHKRAILFEKISHCASKRKRPVFGDEVLVVVARVLRCRHDVHLEAAVGIGGFVGRVVVGFVGVNEHILCIHCGWHSGIVFDKIARAIDQRGVERVLTIGHDRRLGAVPRPRPLTCFVFHGFDVGHLDLGLFGVKQGQLDLIAVRGVSAERALENELVVFGVEVGRVLTRVFGDGRDVELDPGVGGFVGRGVVDLEFGALEHWRFQAIDGGSHLWRVGTVKQSVGVRDLNHKLACRRGFAGVGFAIDLHFHIGIVRCLARNTGSFVGGDVVFGACVIFGHQGGRGHRWLLRVLVDVDQLAVDVGGFGRAVTDQGTGTVDDAGIKRVLAVGQFGFGSVP